eukprot:COSAG05_NODE_2373_length_3161_cov_16.174233_2_plen_84_part_00
MQTDKPQKAAKAASKAREIEPTHFHAMLIDAMLKQQAGDYFEANVMGNLMTSTLCDKWPELRERCLKWAGEGGLHDNAANLFT